MFTACLIAMRCFCFVFVLFSSVDSVVVDVLRLSQTDSFMAWAWCLLCGGGGIFHFLMF